MLEDRRRVQVCRGRQRRGVVFEPREAPRPVHPEAAQESQLADRAAHVCGQAGSRGEHEQNRSGGRAQSRRDEHDGADVGRAEQRPREGVPQRRCPTDRRHRREPTLPGAAPLFDQAIADARDAHFFSGRRRGRDRKEMPRQAIGLSRALLCPAFDGRPPRGREHRGYRERREEHQPDVHGREQRHRDAEPQDPPARRKERHVHVIEHEHLIAQHREAVEKLGALMMSDGPDRRLETGHVGFERDRHLVAEAPLHTRADDAQEPRRRGRHGEADRRAEHERPPVLQQAPAEQHEPERDQRVGQRGQLRQHERGEHQPRLVPVTEPAQPPHRRERRRQRPDWRRDDFAHWLALHLPLSTSGPAPCTLPAQHTSSAPCTPHPFPSAPFHSPQPPAPVSTQHPSFNRARHRFSLRPPAHRTAAPAARTSSDSGRVRRSARRASRAR